MKRCCRKLKKQFPQIKEWGWCGYCHHIFGGKYPEVTAQCKCGTFPSKPLKKANK